MPDENESLKLKLFGPVASAAGATLQDTWDLVFGGFGNYVEKKRLARGKALEDFKATLEKNVNEIPIDQLREPPISVIGPALEASKYYFEEEEIRAMFARVISASMDARVNSLVHPSFPTIIQQLSSIDAQNLACFCPEGGLPICEYQVKITGNYDNPDFVSGVSYRLKRTNVFLSNPNIRDLEQGSVSIATLSRLGLIDISYEKNLNDADYHIFEETDEFRTITSDCEASPDESPYIQKGVAVLTPLGTNLCTICFPDFAQSDS